MTRCPYVKREREGKELDGENRFATPMSSKATSRLRFEKISIAFAGLEIVRDFDLIVAPGEKVALAGPSGCGKSSVLHCLLGFVQPASGRIFVDDDTLSPRSVWRLRRRIAYVGQEPDLGEELVGGWIDRQFDLRANEAIRHNLAMLPGELERLGLSQGILGKRGPDLSGGEKQRIAMVAALLLNREILVLDEPTSALDALARQRVYVRLGELRDTTILMVSHDDTENLGFVNRIARMDGGEDGNGRH
jgi:putative ABC transport system ATP-binding protein